MKIIYSRCSRSGLCDRPLLCRFALSLALVFAAFPHTVLAVDGKDENEWQHRTAAYLWMAGLDGSTGNSIQAGEIEASFSDILSNFEAGFMFDYRGKKGKWGLGLDLIYLNIGPSPTVTGPNPAPVGPPTISAEGDVDLKQWIVDFTGRYEVKPGFELLAGGRYVDLDVDATINFPGPERKQLNISGTESWVDPIIGAEYRGNFPGTDKWSYLMHGDVGGFGVSSDLTWQLYGYVGYRPTPKWLIYGGYRHMKIDYESDNQAKFFYDMAVGGPVLGVGYHF
jgi:hypothetical protein